MAEGGGGSDETCALSPTNNVKFMCSFGGKIMPRPADGSLRYVGGETRVVVVPRDINFTELMQKLRTLLDGDHILKYQMMPEDLDALITVRSDEDLHHMIGEYDRQETKGTPKLRAFLFPSTPIIFNNHPTSAATDPPSSISLEHYLDAINGVACQKQRMSIVTGRRPTVCVYSSACSSPNSVSPNSVSPVMNNEKNKVGGGMHRVKSSPAMCSFNGNNKNYQPGHYHSHQIHGSHRIPMSRGSGGLMGWGDTRRSQVDQGLNNYYGKYQQSRDGNGRFDVAGSVPQSPRKVLWE